MTPTVSIVRNSANTFFALTIDYAGKLWRYNVSDKFIEVEGWEPFLFGALDKIARDESIDAEVFRSDVAPLLLRELRKLRPPRPKPMKTAPKPRPKKKAGWEKLEKEMREALEDPPPPPPKALQTYVPLPMARVRRQQAARTLSDLWAWVRKILRC